MGASKEQAEITRKNLLTAGFKVFSKKGFVATRLEDVAKEAGVTRGAFYWHFKNKLELFSEVYFAAVGTIFSDFQSILQSNLTPYEKLRRFLIHIPVKLIEDEDFHTNVKLHYKIEWTEEVKKTLVTRFWEGPVRIKELLIQVIEAGKASGIFRNDLATSIIRRMTEIFLVGLIYEMLDDFDNLRKEEILSVVECFLKGILNDDYDDLIQAAPGDCD